MLKGVTDIGAVPFNAYTSAVKEGELYTLTILHTNDIHGHVNHLPQYSTIIKKVRAETKNVLVLDGGDLFLRGEFQHLQGEVETELLNAMGFDAWVPGNNDFKVPPDGGTIEDGNAQLKKFIDNAEFSAVCANVTMKESGDYIAGIKPYVIKELNDAKIGIIGVTSLKPHNRKWTEVSDKFFESGDTAVSKIINEVNEKSDIALVLSHTGFAIDLKIAKVKGVSAVLGADDHYKLSEPIYMTNGGNKTTPITQNGGEDNNCLGRLDLAFKMVNGEMVLQDFDGYLYDLSYIKGDEEVQKIIDSYRKSSDKAETAA
ncbi:hypothetical protein SDC9_96008 [bioreactor metagenome]|uniref:Calcineurin-like phosphoesterase domain-containing protein n=1 Tax=bioreactor metagenome TaxID=1076179 RepID=A0A645A7Y3_9ZZZZ